MFYLFLAIAVKLALIRQKERGAGVSPAPLVHYSVAALTSQVSIARVHAEDSDTLPDTIIIGIQ
jgi:hypothetical protein